jgi:hypothetical protein
VPWERREPVSFRGAFASVDARRRRVAHTASAATTQQQQITAATAAATIHHSGDVSGAEASV